jgi:hypothetical protein
MRDAQSIITLLSGALALLVVVVFLLSLVLKINSGRRAPPAPPRGRVERPSVWREVPRVNRYGELED